MSDDLVKRLRATTDGATVNPDGPEAAARIGELEAAIQQARRDGREEAARRVEIMWLMFREKDNGASDWIFRAHDDIPTGDDFVAAIRALGEKE